MARFDDAPDKYWHCYFGKEGERPQQYAMAHDLSKQQLIDQVIDPWRSRRPLIVGGTAVRDHDAIKEMRIVRTPRRSHHYEEVQSRNFAEAGVFTLAGMGFAAFHDGKDYTNELLAVEGAAKPSAAEIETLVRLCTRLPEAIRPLVQRQRRRKPFKIADEYDVQDVLNALIRGYFQYVVSEEPIQKLANAKSTRADFAIEALGTIVEVKFVRRASDQARVVKQLAEDLLLYERWAHLKAVIYVVCNSSKLRDPEALEKLAGHRRGGGRQYDVHVVRA